MIEGKVLEIRPGGDSKPTIFTEHLSDGWEIVTAYCVVDTMVVEAREGRSTGDRHIRHFVVLKRAKAE